MSSIVPPALAGVELYDDEIQGHTTFGEFMQRNAVEPSFEEKFTRPTTVVELLDRSLEWARDEKRWSSGHWLSIINWPDNDENGEVDWSKLSCTDVRACSMSIMLLSSMNGPLIRAYYKTDGMIPLEDLCRKDPLVSEGAMYLASALFQVLAEGDARQRISTYRRSGTTGVGSVINYNDEIGSGSEAHHSRIVAGFELALKLAREDEAPATA